ncbi:MAG: NTPase KAP, partial [Acidobacteriota bacterium]
EKILQMAFDLPVPSPDVISSQLFSILDEVIKDIDSPGELVAGDWVDIYYEIVAPLLRNMRDVRRYAIAVHGALSDLEGRISMADVLALEAVRVFLPDVFAELHPARGALTAVGGFGYSENPELKRSVLLLVEVGADDEAVVKSLVSRVFPAAGRHLGGLSYGESFRAQWRQNRRVAHEDYLLLYLERIGGAALTQFDHAEQAFEVLDDGPRLSALFESLHSSEIEGVTQALESFEDKFEPRHVRPAVPTLLNALPLIPDRQRGMFDFGKEIVVERVVLRLLRALDGPEDVRLAVDHALPQVNTLRGQWLLITLVGYLEGAGQKLVTESEAADLYRQWRQRLRDATAEQLLEEEHLLDMAYWHNRLIESGEPALEIGSDPRIVARLLESASTETISSSMEGRAITRHPRLHWDSFVEVVGGEDRLRQQIDELKQSGVDVDAELLALVDRYLDGWRPRPIEAAALPAEDG